MSNFYQKWQNNKKIEPNNLKTTNSLSSLAQQTNAKTLPLLCNTPNNSNLFRISSPQSTQPNVNTVSASNLSLRGNSLQFKKKNFF